MMLLLSKLVLQLSFSPNNTLPGQTCVLPWVQFQILVAALKTVTSVNSQLGGWMFHLEAESAPIGKCCTGKQQRTFPPMHLCAAVQTSPQESCRSREFGLEYNSLDGRFLQCIFVLQYRRLHRSPAALENLAWNTGTPSAIVP